MAKRDIIRAVAKKNGIPQEYVRQFLDAVLESLPEILQEKEKISVRGFGVLYVKDLPERKRRSPFNNEEIIVPPQKMVKFKPYKVLIGKLNSNHQKE